MLPDSLRLIREASLKQLRDERWLTDAIATLGIEHPTHQAPDFPANFGGLLAGQTPIQFAPYLIHLSTLGIRSYVELGAYYGGSLMITVEYLTRFGPVDRIGVVDVNIQPLVREFCEAHPGGSFVQTRTDSGEAAAYLREMQPDLVLVDADHSEPCCRADTNLATLHARYVALHDIAEWSCPGVALVWNDLKVPRREFAAQYDDGPTIHGLGLAGPFDRQKQIESQEEAEPAMRYEVTGIPLSPSPVSGHRIGDIIDLDLSAADEAAWTGAGAIRKLPEPKPEPKKQDKSSGSDKPDS